MAMGKFGYHVVMTRRTSESTPSSIIAAWVQVGKPLWAILWSVPRKEWIYAPGIAAGLMYDDQNFDRVFPVNRETAEHMSRGDLGTELPSEEQLLRMCEEAGSGLGSTDVVIGQPPTGVAPATGPVSDGSAHLMSDSTKVTLDARLDWGQGMEQEVVVVPFVQADEWLTWVAVEEREMAHRYLYMAYLATAHPVTPGDHFEAVLEDAPQGGYLLRISDSRLRDLHLHLRNDAEVAAFHRHMEMRYCSDEVPTMRAWEEREMQGEREDRWWL